jgi:hypothetical protein
MQAGGSGTRRGDAGGDLVLFILTLGARTRTATT